LHAQGPRLNVPRFIVHLTRLLITLGAALTLSAVALALFASSLTEHVVPVRLLATVEGLVGVILLVVGLVRLLRGNPQA
jgi:hypothetical protein